jgi:hypothetical protein
LRIFHNDRDATHPGSQRCHEWNVARIDTTNEWPENNISKHKRIGFASWPTKTRLILFDWWKNDWWIKMKAQSTRDTTISQNKKNIKITLLQKVKAGIVFLFSFTYWCNPVLVLYVRGVVLCTGRLDSRQS